MLVSTVVWNNNCTFPSGEDPLSPAQSQASFEEKQNVLNPIMHASSAVIPTRAPRKTLGPARGRYVLLERGKRLG